MVEQVGRLVGQVVLRVLAGEQGLVGANVYYTNAAGEVVMMIEDMQCIASQALNRLGGTAGQQPSKSSV